MGNICRSPTAEGFFKYHLDSSAHRQHVLVDSAGTNAYHVGDAPDPRAIAAAQKHGVDIRSLRACKVVAEDFTRQDMIIAMDRENFATLQALKPVDCRAQLHMMMAWHPAGEPSEVPDPYYGDFDGFDDMCKLLDTATAALAEDVVRHLNH